MDCVNQHSLKIRTSAQSRLLKPSVVKPLNPAKEIVVGQGETLADGLEYNLAYRLVGLRFVGCAGKFRTFLKRTPDWEICTILVDLTGGCLIVQFE